MPLGSVREMAPSTHGSAIETQTIPRPRENFPRAPAIHSHNEAVVRWRDACVN
jgi:hypothetical protein